MAEPWPISKLGHGFHVLGDEPTLFVTEKAARRYAALPVLLATIREACEPPQCAFCCEIASDEFPFVHMTDCPGIAALKAAGEEIA